MSIEDESMRSHSMPNTWSDYLMEETRNALHDGFVGADGFLHMKNINGNFGKICLENLMYKKLLIQDKRTDVEYCYTSADELIMDGWAID